MQVFVHVSVTPGEKYFPSPGQNTLETKIKGINKWEKFIYYLQAAVHFSLPVSLVTCLKKGTPPNLYGLGMLSVPLIITY